LPHNRQFHIGTLQSMQLANEIPEENEGKASDGKLSDPGGIP